MFQMQARTTGIPPPLTIPFYYQTKQEQHTGKQRVVQNLWEKIPQDCWAISSFSHQLNLLWKTHVFPWTDKDVLRLLQPCLPAVPSPSAGICWIPLSCPRKTNQSKVNPEREKLFDFWPAQLPEPVCGGARGRPTGPGMGQENHISPDDGWSTSVAQN